MDKLKKIKMFSPLFILFSIIVLYFGNILHFLIYAIVVFVHEFAHYFVSKKLGYSLSKLYLMPYGICLNYKDSVFSGNDEIYIALAGPLVNYLLCIICVSLWWLFPETYYYLDYFCFCNLILATFNLIPCFPLDGGRVLIGLVSKKYDREKVFKFAVILNYIISFILVILFIVSFLSKQTNYSFIMFAFFLFSGCVNPNKYSSYNYLNLQANKQASIKNGTSIKIFASTSSTPLYKIISKFSKYKYNIVYIIFTNGKVSVFSETNIQKLAINYSPAFSIDEILLIK